MNTYTKVIGLQGSYFIKEHKKPGKHQDKLRPVQEHTVASVFKEGDCQIIIIFEEQNKTMEITSDSPVEDIKKFLGPKFL